MTESIGHDLPSVLAAAGSDSDGDSADPVRRLIRRPLDYVHVVALALAAAADTGAFFQVIALVMPQQTAPVVGAVVLGFTGVVLYLAHVAGALARELKATALGTHRFPVYLCLVAWSLLGVFALLARLIVQGGASSAPSALSVTGPSTSGPWQTEVVVSAAMFFALYVATGVVAAVGGFLTHAPRAHSGYAAAVRAKLNDPEHAVMLGHQPAGDGTEDVDQFTEFRAAERMLREADQVRSALAEQMEELSRSLIAQRTAAPIATEEVSKSDRRPRNSPSDLIGGQ